MVTQHRIENTKLPKQMYIKQNSRIWKNKMRGSLRPRPNSDAGGEVSGPAAKPFSVSTRQTKDLGKTSIGEPPSM